MTASILSFGRQRTVPVPPKMPWQNQDLAELYRVRDRLCASGLSVEVEGGVSDEGDPWFIYQQAGTDMVVVHIARIDTYIHVINCITGTTYIGSTFREVSDRMLDDAPVVLGARVRRASNVVMHPSAFLTAFVAAALMLLDAPGEAEAGEATDAATGDPAYVLSHVHEDGHRSEAGDNEATLPASSAAAYARRGQKEGSSSSGPFSLSHAHLAEMAIGASMTLSAGLLTSELMHLLRPDGASPGHQIDVSLLAFFITSNETLLDTSWSVEEAPKSVAVAAPALVKAHHDVGGVNVHELNSPVFLPGHQAPKLDDFHLEVAASVAVDLPMPQGQFGTLSTVPEAGSQPSQEPDAAVGKLETPTPEKEASVPAAASVPVATVTSQEQTHVTSAIEVSATASLTTTAPPAASMLVKVDLTLVKATWIFASDTLPTAQGQGDAADKLTEGGKLTVAPLDDTVASILPHETAAPVIVVDTDIHHLVGTDSIALLAGYCDIIHYSPTSDLVLEGFVMGEDVIMFADEATGINFMSTARQVGEDLVMGQDGGDTVRIVGVLADAVHPPVSAA